VIDVLIQTVIYQSLIRLIALTLAAEAGSALATEAIPSGNASAPGTATFDSRNAERDNVYQRNPERAYVIAIVGFLGT
jgi:hypothetical protein